MKTHGKYLTYLVTLGCLAATYTPSNGRSATIWNGPLITYTQPAPDPSQPANQDILTTHVSLTRAVPVGGGTGGIFNGLTETRFTKGVSPDGTEWAFGELTNYANLTYTDWAGASGFQAVHTYPGQQCVVHLIADDIYLSLMFTDLPAGPGFTYIRSTPAPVAPPTITISAVTASSLTLSWPAAGPRLQSQTNGLGTNWGTVANSTTTNRMVIPINRANNSVFFRLAVP